ncbi:MAG: hypothetical protein GY925_21100 [Actinomycetia bacterium]|nr:hypothetical protein [Actinomycetes bacterium]
MTFSQVLVALDDDDSRYLEELFDGRRDASDAVGCPGTPAVWVLAAKLYLASGCPDGPAPDGVTRSRWWGRMVWFCVGFGFAEVAVVVGTVLA